MGISIEDLQSFTANNVIAYGVVLFNLLSNLNSIEQAEWIKQEFGVYQIAIPHSRGVSLDSEWCWFSIDNDLVESYGI